MTVSSLGQWHRPVEHSSIGGIAAMGFKVFAAEQQQGVPWKRHWLHGNHGEILACLPAFPAFLHCLWRSNCLMDNQSQVAFAVLQDSKCFAFSSSLKGLQASGIITLHVQVPVSAAHVPLLSPLQPLGQAERTSCRSWLTHSSPFTNTPRNHTPAQMGADIRVIF